VRIGIFLSSRNPKEGGGYTITYDIFKSLFKNIKDKDKNQYIFIILNDFDNSLKKIIIKNNFKYKEFKENKFIIKIKNFLFSKFPTLLEIYRKFDLDKFQRLENELNIGVVWFISAEYFYPIFKKYISTVWDLQHRTHPQFPEVGGIFVRYYRDAVISSFLKNSYKIITGTNYLKNKITEFYNIKKKKVVLAPHPTPTIYLQNIKLYKTKKKYFFYPANFWHHKNHLNLIKGFDEFNLKNNYKYKLILVGSIKNKKYFDKILKLKNSLNSNQNIKILNFVSVKKMVNLYDNCLALIYASYCGPENLPPLEAFARNKPVICSDYDGAREQLKKLPIFFNPNNPRVIANAINFFLKNRMTVNYRKFALSRSVDKYFTSVLHELKSFQKS
jgi:glycosyltransferase involved in cell wall biosynthesis